jgi:cytochrome P450
VGGELPRKVTPLQGLDAWKWYLKFYSDPLGCLLEANRRFGPIMVFDNTLPGPLSGARYVIVVGRDLNREVLSRTEDFRPSGLVLNGPPGSAQRRIRHGIFQMYGKVHRRHRRMMQPSFATTRVTSMVEAMAPLVDDVIDRWRPGEPFDMLTEMRTLSNWIAAKVLFGNEDFSASVNIGRLIDRFAVLDTQRRKWGMVDLNLPGSPYYRGLRHAEVLEKAMIELIEHKRRTKSSSDDVLSVLIRAAEAGSGMSDNDLIAHSVGLYGASFETTASGLAWTMFLIAQHPGVAARLHDELSQHLPSWPPDPDKLETLPFLNGVVCESLRLMPPIPMTFRRVTRDVELQGVKLKPGHKVIVCEFLTHRDPTVFPNPNRFDPSRWIDFRPDPYEYLPFSVGLRVCLGAFFAMTELKLVVARVMQKYRLSVVPHARIDPDVHFVLKPRSGLPMFVTPQDHAFSRSPLRGTIGRFIDMASPEPEPVALSRVA